MSYNKLKGVKKVIHRNIYLENEKPLKDDEIQLARNMMELRSDTIMNSYQRQIIDAFYEKHPPIEGLSGSINRQIAQQTAIIYNQLGGNMPMLGAGINQLISLLTRQANKLIRAKYFRMNLAKFIYIDASAQHWFEKETVAFEKPALHDDFHLGIAHHRYGQAMTTQVEPMFGLSDVVINSWKKHINFTDEEIKTYDANPMYNRALGSLVNIKQKALKANCDLGFQRFLMIGHPDAPEYKSFLRYVTDSTNIFKDMLKPDKSFSQMDTGELEAWCKDALTLYKYNTKQNLAPNRLLLPPSEWNALGMSASPQIATRTKADVIEGFFKNSRSDFKIEECVYLAKEYNGKGTTYGCLYNNDKDNLFVLNPLVPTWSPMEYINGFGNMVRVLRFRFSDIFCAIPESFMGFEMPEADPNFKGGALRVNIDNIKDFPTGKEGGKESQVEGAPQNLDELKQVEAKIKEAEAKAKMKEAEAKAKIKEAEAKAKELEAKAKELEAKAKELEAKELEAKAKETETNK